MILVTGSIYVVDVICRKTVEWLILNRVDGKKKLTANTVINSV